MIKGLIHQEDTTILNVHASTLRDSKYMKHKLVKLKMILYVEILRSPQKATRILKNEFNNFIRYKVNTKINYILIY